MQVGVTRVDAGTAIVSLGKSEAILPRSEQIAGESHHVGERVKAVIFEVRRTGHRVKIVLSRAHPDFIRNDWKLDVMHDNTQRGYWEWVAQKIEEAWEAGVEE